MSGFFPPPITFQKKSAPEISLGLWLPHVLGCSAAASKRTADSRQPAVPGGDTICEM